jgi:hypothetical protein
MSCTKRYIIVVDQNLSKGEKGDKGDPGDNGLGALPLSTDDVLYGPTNQTLSEILAELLYLALEITSFTGTSQYEKGQVLTSIFLSWGYNKAIQTQSITGTGVVPPTLLVGDTSKTVTLSNVSTDTVITLTADDVIGDGHAAKTATLELKFLNKIYWGKAVIGTINSAFILSLQGELKQNRIKSFVEDTGLNEYIWFCSPVAYGAATFIADGFVGGFQLETTISFTNASGHTEDYYVYRSVNHNLGSINIDVI